MTVALADGQAVYVVRYPSNNQSPSLYRSTNLDAMREVGGTLEEFSENTTIILSEPLDEVSKHWQ